MTAVALLFAETLALAAAWFLICRRDTGTLKRLSRYVNLKVAGPDGKKRAEDLYEVLDSKMDRLPLTRTIFNYFEQLLTVANLPIKTSEFLIGTVLLMISSLMMQVFLSGGFNAGAVVVLLGSLFLPLAVLKIHIHLRMKKLRRQLKLAISLLANGMRAGNSFVQALRHVSADLEEPLAGEFEFLLNENRLGIPIEEALNNMSRRVPCPEMRSLVRGVIFQQQTGGNLVYVLKTLYQTLQDRDDLRNKISILTIQGKISGVVCISVPFFMFLLMHKSNPAYTQVLLGTQMGHYLLMICALLLVVGSALVYKIVSFKF